MTKIELQNSHAEQHAVLKGGPVATDQVFLLFREVAESERAAIRLSASRTDLEKLAADVVLHDVLISMGYCGWAGQQLDEEVYNDDWLVVPANSRIMFDIPYEQRWRAAGLQVGIDMMNIVGNSGNA